VCASLHLELIIRVDRWDHHLLRHWRPSTSNFKTPDGKATVQMCKINGPNA